MFLLKIQLRIKKSVKLLSDNQEMRNTQLLRVAYLEKKRKKQVVKTSIFEN